MKRISMILLSLICLLGFSASVNAVSYSSSITVNKSGTSYEYIDGIEVYYNKTSSYDVYGLETGTYFASKSTFKEPVTSDPGFTYIINNSKVTSTSARNYYIAQVAILWYQDYLSGNDYNISSTLKNYIKNNTSDTTCYYVNKLVNGAINYKETNNSIVLDNKNVSFYKSGSYYYSNIINVETYGLKSKPTVKYYNAPTSTTTVNNNLVASGDGSFQIRIPESSLEKYTKDDFEVLLTGSKSSYSTATYYNLGEYLILGRVYTSSSDKVEASLIALLDNFADTNVRIKIVDENDDYLNGIKFSIYSGDCSNKTCSNLVKTYTTSRNYTSLNNVLSAGTYTIVISNYSNYNLPQKQVITVRDTTSTQTFTIKGSNNDDDNDDYDYLTNLTIYNDINDAKDYIKIYKTSGSLVKTYISTNTKYSLQLDDGTYYIVDTENYLDKLYFIISNGVLEVKENNSYYRVNYIDLRNNQENDNDQENNNPENNNDNNQNNENQNNNENNNTFENHYEFDDYTVDVDTNVDTTTTVDVETVDCPITGVSSIIKYTVGATILSIGSYLVYRNVKKSKNNC